jgi:hypothetical protein
MSGLAAASVAEQLSVFPAVGLGCGGNSLNAPAVPGGLLAACLAGGRAAARCELSATVSFRVVPASQSTRSGSLETVVAAPVAALGAARWRWAQVQQGDDSRAAEAWPTAPEAVCANRQYLHRP